MKIAYFSPLPPLGSGIADYSAELLPFLVSAGADVTLFVDDKVAPRLPAGADHLAVHSYRRFDKWLRSQGDVVPLYHVGNNADYHAYIYQTLLKHPGVVVLHDYVLHHLVMSMTVARKDIRGYLAAMVHAYSDAGVRAAQDLLAGKPVDFFAYPLVERVLERCTGVITHNRYVRQLVRRASPKLPVRQINMHFTLPAAALPLPDQDAIRAELGLSDRLVLASFGWITPQKRLDIALRAFACLLSDFPNALYLLVGQPSPQFDIEGLVATLGLGNAVRIIGRTSLRDFIHTMLATDIALNLRYPTAGETSASLIRLLGLGIPTLVSNVGGFADFPDDCCAKIDVDAFEEEAIFAILKRLAGDVDFRRQMGDNARRYTMEAHAPEHTARDYLAFVTQVASGTATGSSALLGSQFVDELGGLLAGMGVTEGDTAALCPVVDALAGLGLTGGDECVIEHRLALSPGHSFSRGSAE
jgi:glycosyltransferase involved in cell wall biosynthesis